MKHYVLGLIFSQHEGRIALLRKKRPAWQAGMLNGIGGHIELGETALQAMVREAAEEVALRFPWPQAWEEIATLRQSRTWDVVVFKTSLPLPNEPEELMGQEDEQVEVYNVNELHLQDLIPNLHYLVQFAVRKHPGDYLYMVAQ